MDRASSGSFRDFFFKPRRREIQKIVVATILLFLASMFTVLVVYNWRDVVRAFRVRERWAESFAMAVALIIISTALDEMGGFLRRHYPTAIDSMFIMWVFEESLEALIPVLFATAIVQAAAVPAAERRHAA